MSFWFGSHIERHLKFCNFNNDETIEVITLVLVEIEMVNFDLVVAIDTL